MSTYDPVLVNIVRRSWLTIIANQIIGVSPRSRYNNELRMPITKQHYKIFLRVNDRPKTQPVRAFRAAGYPTEICYESVAVDWCNEQFGQHGFLRFGSTFVFKDDGDATLFKMRWL